MALLVCATELEAGTLRQAGYPLLVTGAGLVDASLRLTDHLARRERPPQLVIHFGVAGAYPGGPARVLDLCLASREVMGDAGLCDQAGVTPFDPAELEIYTECVLDEVVLRHAQAILQRAGHPCHLGTFVTVNCASATTARGAMLHHQWDGLCENMEGAAVARVCRHFAVPLVEVRAVSNMVEDRDRSRWRLAEAADRAATAARLLADGFAAGDMPPR